MIDVGLKVKEYISEEDSSGVIVVKNEVFHHTYTHQQYEEFLEELIEDGKMEKTTFKENDWCFIGEFGNKSNVKFPFEFNHKVNTLLKHYAIFKAKIQNNTVEHIRAAVTSVIFIIQKTKFFSLNQLVDFSNELNNWSEGGKRKIHHAKEFLRFTQNQIDNGEQYYEVLDNVCIPTSPSRLLPSYKSIMTFDYIVNDFILNGSDDLKLKYYPILIWWQLTKIIPLRPIELSLLQRDWLYQKNGSYFIKIERRKKRQGQLSSQNILPLKEFEISEELFFLIHRYIELGRAFNDAPYILDYAFIKHNLNQTIFKTRVNHEFADNNTLNRNLRKRFFEEIVSNQYGYTVIPKQDEELDYSSNEIEMIDMGDTRHIAICSMMLQGMNELTIAQIAGHRNLTEQIGYCNHLDSYATAYTHRLAKSFQNSIKVKMDVFETKSLAQKQLISRALVDANLGEAMKVDHGYCISKNFPFECEIDDCLFCPHFIGSKDMSQEMLDQKLEILNQEIKTKMNYIKSVVSHQADVRDDTESKTNAKSLGTLFKHKAIVEAYKSQIREG